MKHKGKIVLSVLILIPAMIFGFLSLGERGKETLILTDPSGEILSGTEEESGEETTPGPEETVPAKETEIGTILVHVCGRVVHPGVYTLTEGSRIYEAVELSGGFAEDAAEDYLNLAGVLTDGMKVYVPSREEAEEGKVPVPDTSEGSTGLVNINTAGEEELMTLTGVGKTRAEAIMAYREKNGPFSSVEEIMMVEGIKEGMFAKIRDGITVN